MASPALATASDELTKLREELEATQSELRFKQKQWLAQEARHAQLYNHVKNKLEAEVANISSERNVYKEKYRGFEKQAADLLELNAGIKRERDQNEKQCKDCEQKLKEKIEDIRKLVTQSNDSGDKSKESDAKIETLRKRYSDCAESLRKMEEKKKGNETSEENCDKSVQNVHEEELEKLKKDNLNLREEIEEHSKKYNTEKDIAHKVQSDLMKIEQDLQECRENLVKVTSEKDGFIDKMEEKYSNCQEEKEKLNLKEKLKKITNELQVCKDENKNERVKVKQFETELHEIQSKHSNCEKEFKKFKDRSKSTDQLESNVAALERKLKEYENQTKEFKCEDKIKPVSENGEFQKCQEDVNTLRKHISVITSERNEFEHRNKLCEEEFKKYRLRETNLRRECDEHEKRCVSLEQDLASRDKDINTLTRARDDLEQQLGDKRRAYEELQNTSLEKYNMEKDKATKAQSDLVKIEKDVEECRESLDKITSERDDFVEKYQRCMENVNNGGEIEEKYKECQQEKENFKIKVNEMEMKYEQCQNELSMCKGERDSFQKQLDNNRETESTEESNKWKYKYEQCKLALQTITGGKNT